MRYSKPFTVSEYWSNSSPTERSSYPRYGLFGTFLPLYASVEYAMSMSEFPGNGPYVPTFTVD